MNPQRKVRLLLRGLALLSGSVIAVAVGLAAGLADPRPAGTRAQPLAAVALRLPAGETATQWQDVALPDPPYTLQFTSHISQVPADVTYGLLLGEADAFLGVGMSPLGYVHVWQRQEGATTDVIPLQPWPHVRPDDNDIWLTNDGRQMTIRVNREWLWSGPARPLGRHTAVSGSSVEAATVITTTLTLLTP